MTDLADLAAQSTPAGTQALAELFARRPLRHLRVVDAHAHAGAYSRFFIPDHGEAGMGRVMDRCGVDVACVSSHLALELDTAGGNAATAALVERGDGRFRGLLVVNPHDDPEHTLAAGLDDPRFVGVKLHPDLHDYPVMGPRYRPVWEAAAALGCPVLVHSWAGSDLDDLTAFAAVAERYPDASVILGHSGARRSHFDATAELAVDYPNLFLEVCGSFMTGSWINHLVETVGADRVLFGSDFPFIDLRYSLGRVLFAGLADDELVQVLGGSVSRLIHRFRPADPAFGDG